MDEHWGCWISFFNWSTKMEIFCLEGYISIGMIFTKNSTTNQSLAPVLDAWICHHTSYNKLCLNCSTFDSACARSGWFSDVRDKISIYFLKSFQFCVLYVICSMGIVSLPSVECSKLHFDQCFLSDRGEKDYKRANGVITKLSTFVSNNNIWLCHESKVKDTKFNGSGKNQQNKQYWK